MSDRIFSTTSNAGGIAGKLFGGGVYLIVAAATIGYVTLTAFPAYTLNLLMQASTYAIAVLGLTIVLGYSGQMNLGHAAFFGMGAYGVALGTTTFGLSFWVSLALGMVVASVAGVVLGLMSLRLGGHYLAMVTISFQMILSLVLTNWVAFTHGPDGISGIGRPSHFVESGPYLGLCVAVLYLVGYLVWHLRRTKLGRAMQATRDNELAAGVVGVDTYRTKVTAFTLSALLGGLGGGLFAGGFAYISPDQFSFNESIVFLTMALLGGSRSPFGTVFGTGLLIMLPEWLRFLKIHLPGGLRRCRDPHHGIHAGWNSGLRGDPLAEIASHQAGDGRRYSAAHVASRRLGGTDDDTENHRPGQTLRRGQGGG